MTKPITCAENDPDSVGYVPDATPEQRAEFARRAERLDRVDAALAKRLADVLKENFVMLAALREIASWKNDTLGSRPAPADYDPELTAAFDRGARMAFFRCANRATSALTNDHQKEQPMTNSP